MKLAHIRRHLGQGDPGQEVNASISLRSMPALGADNLSLNGIPDPSPWRVVMASTILRAATQDCTMLQYLKSSQEPQRWASPAITYCCLKRHTHAGKQGCMSQFIMTPVIRSASLAALSNMSGDCHHLWCRNCMC
jgi:hypothetical protein